MDKKFSIVIFGTGSIGRRHYEIAQNLENCNSYIFSKKVSRNLELKTLGYNIYKFDKKCNLGIIATEANNHIKDIKKFFKYAEKWIIEKPIYSIYEDHSQDSKDLIFDKNIFIGYNKRFELGIYKLFNFIKDKKIKNAHFKCFSNLEKWRDEPVSESISLDFKKGGGVLNELSHEIDLANYFIGSIKEIIGKTKQRKYKNSLVEDTAFLTLIHDNGIESKVDISFGCKSDLRKSILFFDDKKLVYNHINGQLICTLAKSNKLIFKKFFQEQRNKSFERQIKSLIFENYDFAQPCSVKDGLLYIQMLEKFQWK